MVALLLLPLETDMNLALQVVEMMAAEIVKAHKITEKHRDDALGIIRNNWLLITSFCIVISLIVFLLCCRAHSSPGGRSC